MANEIKYRLALTVEDTATGLKTTKTDDVRGDWVLSGVSSGVQYLGSVAEDLNIDTNEILTARLLWVKNLSTDDVPLTVGYDRTGTYEVYTTILPGDAHLFAPAQVALQARAEGSSGAYIEWLLLDG